MMTLAQAAEAFNAVVFSDLDGFTSFTAMVLPFNDSTRSGETSMRRILKVAPATEVPEVIVEVETGGVFLRSTPSIDYFIASAIRKKYVIIPAETEYATNSPTGILSGTTAIYLQAQTNYTRRVSLADQSDYLSGYLVILPSESTVFAGDLIWAGDNYFRAIEDSYVDDIGFTVVDCIKLDNPIQTLSIVTKTAYDPVTETDTTAAPVSVLCIVEDREKSFAHTREDAEKTLQGDITIKTLHNCSAGDTVGGYLVVSKLVEGSLNILQCRRP